MIYNHKCSEAEQEFEFMTISLKALAPRWMSEVKQPAPAEVFGVPPWKRDNEPKYYPLHVAFSKYMEALASGIVPECAHDLELYILMTTINIE